MMYYTQENKSALAKLLVWHVRIRRHLAEGDRYMHIP